MSSSNPPAPDRFAALTSGLLEGGEIRFRPASDRLRKYVGCFWIIEAGVHCKIRTVPDLCSTLSINLKSDDPPRVRLGRPSTRSRTHRLVANSRVVGVRMKPAVISLLAGPSASKLARLQRELSTQLQLDGPLGRDPEDWIDALDAILTVRLPGQELDCVIARALDEAAARAGLLRAAELSEAVGISPRHLRRLFRSWVGLSPKQALRILRFQSTLRQVSSRLTSPAEAAAASGYFDQSHLARESARLAQVTPGRLISSQVADFSKTICQLSPKVGE